MAVVAAFLFAAAAAAWIVGVSLLFPNRLLDRMWALNKPAEAAFKAAGWIPGTLLTALGVATAWAAVGLLRGRNWAWWFAVVLFSVNVCGDVVGYFLLRDLPRSASGIAIASAFLYALSRPRVRRYFCEPARRI